MERQNITISLPRELLKKAKSMAALQDKSLSQFMRESLESKMKETGRYKRARQRQIRFLQVGWDLGTKGHLKVKRDELHER